MSGKICADCRIAKDASAFGRRGGKRGGQLQSVCKPCRNKRTVAGARKRIAGYRRRAEAGDPVAIAYVEKLRKNARDVNTATRKRLGTEAMQEIRYGMPTGSWRKVFESQDERCAACESPDPRNARGWTTDHDHVSGQVRGILCHPCNAMLGQMGDNEAGVRTTTERLLAYLESVDMRMALAGITPKPRRPRNPHAHLELHHVPRVFRPSPVVTYGQ